MNIHNLISLFSLYILSKNYDEKGKLSSALAENSLLVNPLLLYYKKKKLLKNQY